MAAGGVDSNAVPQSKKGAVVISNIHTDIVCTSFTDKLMLIITQYQKLGTVMYVFNEAEISGMQQPLFNTKVLIGKDEPVTHVYARNIALKLHQLGNTKPLLLTLALKDDTPEMLKAILESITQCKVW
ncbi:proteasome assembly chaperone 3-like [Anneissia japonica]|uniref:proteasome assembly chaperone 3-like n=1 Tax=Anneissia japonica TaxID=1529436 RepID=UPI001425AB2B|nr:proteasome assembly chaperone 3-like [Anneissia japonica]